MAFTQEQIKEAYKKLPEKVRLFMASEEVADALSEVSTKNSFTFEQARSLGNLTGLIMMDLLKKEDFKSELKTRIPTLSEEMIEQIYQNVDRIAFEPMNHLPEIVESESEVVEDESIAEEGPEPTLTSPEQQPSSQPEISSTITPEPSKDLPTTEHFEMPTLVKKDQTPQMPVSRAGAIKSTQAPRPYINPNPYIRTTRPVNPSQPLATQTTSWSFTPTPKPTNPPITQTSTPPVQPTSPTPTIPPATPFSQTPPSQPKSIFEAKLSGTTSIPKQEVNLKPEAITDNIYKGSDPYREPPTP